MKEKELNEDIVEDVAIDKEENKDKELDIVEAEKVEEKE